MTRKEILKLAAAVGGAATLLTALGGCAAPTTPTPAAQKLCEPGCVMPAPQSEIGRQKLYFKDSLHGAKTESETKIFNVAEPLTYNPKAATDWVNFFETFATEDKRQFNVKFGQIVTNLQVEPRKPDKRLVIINNPQRADEQSINAIEKAIETTPFGQQEHLLSVLTISPETDLNRDFAYTMWMRH